EKLEIADGEFVHPQVLVSVYALDRADVRKVRMFCVFQVMKYGARGDGCFMQLFYPESFQRMCFEMFKHAFRCVLVIEYPAFEGIGIKLRSESFPEVFL